MTDTAREFRTLFSRFDHALVYAKFLQKSRGEARADWKAFANNEMTAKFFKFVQDSKCADILINSPPKKLMNEFGDLEWKSVGGVFRNVEDLFIHGVLQVRNSLYHGHKYIGSVEQQSCDEVLVSEAMWVLEESINRSPKIRPFFK
jgi:hypothetical protein